MSSTQIPTIKTKAGLLGLKSGPEVANYTIRNVTTPLKYKIKEIYHEKYGWVREDDVLKAVNYGTESKRIRRMYEALRADMLGKSKLQETKTTNANWEQK